MTNAQILPAVVIPIVLWRVYSRFRRSVGRQPFRPRRLIMAVVIFSVITGLIGWGAVRFPSALAALGGGLALGVPLGIVALRLTRFEATKDGEFYTPNAVIGICVTLVLVGRVLYRMMVLFGMSRDLPPPSLFQNPLTLLIFGVTSGYYISYYLGVFLRGRKDLRTSRF